ncbi:hypothetical protein ACXR6G_11020 [Ancylomarina sp. YFZ004]
MKKTNELIHFANQIDRPKEKLQALYLRSRNYQGLKSYIEAINHYKEAYQFSIQQFAKNKENKTLEYCIGILKQMSYSYWYASKLDEGIRYFSELIETKPNASKAIKRAYLGDLYSAKGNYT